ncbi:MAG: hypothetical protein PHY43_13080 [Verrucomicrobiales bacterium]|nr:hypothetical protein [Verrucomicrobiales bacterium]
MKTALLSVLFMAGVPVMAGPVPPVTDATASVHSVFILPAGPKDGRDPFYPSSSRPYQAAVLPSARTTDLNLDSLVMQGVSGMPPNRLAIINKHTFAVGDYAEVSTTQGRIHVHCLEINSNSAVIEVNGQRHELRYEENQ